MGPLGGGGGAGGSAGAGTVTMEEWVRRVAKTPSASSVGDGPAGAGGGGKAGMPPPTASLFGGAAAGGVGGGSDLLGFSASVAVTIDETETREDGHGRYSSFRVAVRSGARAWTVARRYREFRALHQVLSHTLPNTKLPKFPPKKYLGSMDPSFVTERREALKRYMQALVLIPAAWRCNELINFLDDSANSLGIQVCV